MIPMERTFVMFKPDCINRGLLGAVIQRLEQKGLKLAGIKMGLLEGSVLEEHYAHHKAKPFFPRIKEFMSSGPVVMSIWEGMDAVEVVRKLAGVTNAREAEAGTIRGDFAMSIQNNILHASDSTEAAAAEIKRFFRPAELFDYARHDFGLVYSKEEQAKGAK